MICYIIYIYYLSHKIGSDNQAAIQQAGKTRHNKSSMEYRTIASCRGLLLLHTHRVVVPKFVLLSSKQLATLFQS